MTIRRIGSYRSTNHSFTGNSYIPPWKDIKDPRKFQDPKKSVRKNSFSKNSFSKNSLKIPPKKSLNHQKSLNTKKSNTKKPLSTAFSLRPTTFYLGELDRILATHEQTQNLGIKRALNNTKGTTEEGTATLRRKNRGSYGNGSYQPQKSVNNLYQKQNSPKQNSPLH